MAEQRRAERPGEEGEGQAAIGRQQLRGGGGGGEEERAEDQAGGGGVDIEVVEFHRRADQARSEEHTSELQSLMRISYAVFCLKKKKQKRTPQRSRQRHSDRNV